MQTTVKIVKKKSDFSNENNTNESPSNNCNVKFNHNKNLFDNAQIKLKILWFYKYEFKTILQSSASVELICSDLDQQYYCYYILVLFHVSINIIMYWIYLSIDSIFNNTTMDIKLYNSEIW